MKFTDLLWNDIEPIYQAIIEHPFNQELAKGTLDPEKFKFYIQQDALYLADFGRALALMASRSANPERMLDFIRFAEGAVVVERALHEDYFRKLATTPPSEKAPGCFTYTNFLLATCSLGSYEEGIAALLPCFWIYREVGRHIYQNAMPHNPYQAWIDTYAGKEFALAVNKAIQICDEVAMQASDTVQKAMVNAFIYSSKLEYIFWDSAYRMEQWQPGNKGQ